MADPADHACRKDDDRERYVEKENRDEGKRCNRHQTAAFERPASDPKHRFQHHRQHRSLEAEEQCLDDAHVAVAGIDPAQHTQRQQSRYDEQNARDQPSLDPVQQPADVNRQLVRFGAWQQGAIVEGMQEPRLADPALLFDQDAVHHRDLAGWAAEAQRGHAYPDPERLTEGHPVTQVDRHRIISDLRVVLLHTRRWTIQRSHGSGTQLPMQLMRLLQATIHLIPLDVDEERIDVFGRCGAVVHLVRVLIHVHDQQR